MLISAFRAATFCDFEESIGRNITRHAEADMKQRRQEEWERVGVEMDSIANISVVGDGGWGKSSLGHSYDANTGEWH